MVPQGGFPTDFTELNLSGWADLVQDMAVGIQALPPRLSLDLGCQVIALLQLLEAATGVGFCHQCCHPRPCCTCMGTSQPAPSMLWSQIVQQAPGYGVTSSSGGVTDLSTSMGGMHGYVAPPPGLTPPDFSIWSTPPQEAPPPPRATGIPVILASHGEGHPNESRYRKAHSGAVGSGTAGPTTAGSSDGATLVPATHILRELASNPISAGGATTK